jgi:hypothetical protein
LQLAAPWAQFLVSGSTDFDDGSQQRMPDGRFVRSDRTMGFLEVTTIGNPAVMESEALLGERRDWRLDGCTWSWIVTIGSHVSVKRLDQTLPQVLRLAEASNTEYALWAPGVDQLPGIAWLRKSGVDLWASRTSDRPGSIYLRQDSDVGGQITDDWDVFVDWIDHVVATPLVIDKLDKLRSWGGDERHLFILVHSSGFDDETALVLMAFKSARVCPNGRRRRSLTSMASGSWLSSPPPCWLGRSTVVGVGTVSNSYGRPLRFR